MFVLDLVFILFYVYECVVCMCVCAPHVCPVPVEVRSGVRFPGVADGCELTCDMWVQEFKPSFSAKAASALNC